MRISTRRWAAVGTAALLAATALTACSSGGSGGGDSDAKTLTVWHYESDDSAMGQAWDKAIEIFKTEHPGVTVDVEHQTFEQIQKNAKIVLTGDDVPDVMEYNKGNAHRGPARLAGPADPADGRREGEGLGQDAQRLARDHRDVQRGRAHGLGRLVRRAQLRRVRRRLPEQGPVREVRHRGPDDVRRLRGGARHVQGERRHAARRGRRRVPARPALVRARPALRRPLARRRLPAVQERRRLARRRDDQGHREAGRVGARRATSPPTPRA